MQVILVIAAHPDDETLGCGGVLSRHADMGDRVFALSLTDGVSARAAPPEAAKQRQEAANLAAECLNFQWLTRGHFPDNAMDSAPLLEVVQFIETVKNDLAPDLIYTHHGADLNVDHRIAFQAVMTAFRPQPGGQVPEIRTFEIPSSTEWSHRSMGAPFAPNLFVDTSKQWEAKLAALKAYGTEMRAFPHARSYEAVDALSTYRGAQAGLPRAEAFQIVRRIVH
jgi:LmbE family N-acetylglucosaminyl deacetylase